MINAHGLIRELRLTRRDVNRLAAALRRGERQEEAFVQTVAEAVQEFQTAADEAHADSQAERTETDRAIAAMQALEALLGQVNLTPEQEAQAASIVSEFGGAHTDLVQRVSDLSAASTQAEGDVPSPPPAP